MTNLAVTEPDDDLISIAQVAQQLGVTRATAERLALMQRFPSRRVAGRLVALRSDVEAFRATYRPRNALREAGRAAVERAIQPHYPLERAAAAELVADTDTDAE